MVEQRAVLARLQFVGMLGRDFDEIAEHAIVLDAQRRHSTLFAITPFEARDHPAAFIAQRPHLVQRRVRARGNETAIAHQKRQFCGQKM